MATSTALRGVSAISFLALSVLGLYFFRILPAQLDIPLNFSDILANKHLNVPYQQVAIPQRYTGIQAFDSFLAIFVSAFSHGPLRLDEDAYWQQLHFLVAFFPAISIWTIEAYRERNQGALISYTSLWAVFYQTVGGAIFIPLHDLCYLFVARDPGYLRAGRAVPLHIAKAFVPALLLGYLLPTVLLFLPGYPQKTVLYFIAFWQFTPFYVNVLVGNFSRLINTFSSSKKIGPTADAGYLIIVYLLCVLASFLAHITTVSGILSGNPEEVSLLSVFLPSQTRLAKSTSQDLHFMFQWDYIIITISSLIWALYAIAEVTAEQNALGIKSGSGRIAALIPIHIILVGPGGAMAAVWWWRENALIEIERKVKEKEKKK